MTLFTDRDERILENLRIINSRFIRKKPAAVRGVRPNPFIHITRHVPMVIIAAVDTRPELHEIADYICTGTDDQDTWRQALIDLGLIDIDGDLNLGGHGWIVVLDGNYWFDAPLLFDTIVFGVKFDGDGHPIVHLNFDSGTGDVGNPLFNVIGSGINYQNPILFHNIHFNGANKTLGRFITEWTLTAKSLIHVDSCTFSNFGDALWWSERGAPRIFRNSEIVNSDFADAAFHFGPGTTLWSLIHHNIWNNCSGDMVSGSGFADHTVIEGNVNSGGTLVENALAGVIYGANYGF